MDFQFSAILPLFSINVIIFITLSLKEELTLMILHLIFTGKQVHIPVISEKDLNNPLFKDAENNF